jgi:hypothetical protein
MITVAECLSIVIADLSLVASGWSLHHRIAKEGLAAFGMAGIDHYQELTSTQRNSRSLLFHQLRHSKRPA